MSYGRSHTRVSRDRNGDGVTGAQRVLLEFGDRDLLAAGGWFERQAATDDPRAQVLKELYDDPHRLLVTLLVGNNVVNIAISSIVTVLVASYLPSGAAVVAVATVLMSFLVLVFGGSSQGVRPRGNAERWSLRIASPIRLVERVLLSPLITLFDRITRRMNAYISGDANIEKPYTD